MARFFSQARRSAKMAVGSDPLLDELAPKTALNKRVVCHIISPSLESVPSGLSDRKPGVSSQAAVNHMASSGTSSCCPAGTWSRRY